MWTPSRGGVRATLLAILLVQSVVLGVSYVDATNTERLPPGESENVTPEDGTSASDGPPSFNGTINLQPRLDSGGINESLDPAGEVTVIATQGFYISDEEADLFAIDRRGDVIYYEDRYRVYFDVDPLEGSKHTIEYVAAKHFGSDDEECAEIGHRCSRNVLNRVNISTGEFEQVYAKITPWHGNNRWHDIDRINDTHVVIADIVRNEVRVVDIEAEETVSKWSATQTYEDDQGRGRGSGDWTHVNDVEILPDGRIMASIRNMDEVIFLEREGDTLAVNDSWTLGEDENYDILHEQHNPDYIPASRGGPAVIVADSENQRILEFHRENGSWKRAWGWKDSRLQWPRDADRLPSGLSLIVDSHGDRVLEVTPEGDPLWTVEVGMPYDVERLGTGDESSGGYAIGEIPPDRAYGSSANRSENETNATGDIVNPDQGAIDRAIVTVKDWIPSVWLNSALYVAPGWIRFTDLLFLLGAGLTGFTLAGSEFWHSRFSARRGLGRLWSATTAGLSGLV